MYVCMYLCMHACMHAYYIHTYTQSLTHFTCDRYSAMSNWKRRCVFAEWIRQHFAPTQLWPVTDFALLLFLLHCTTVRIEVSRCPSVLSNVL